MTKGLEHQGASDRAGTVQPCEGSDGSWQCIETPDGSSCAL